MNSKLFKGKLPPNITGWDVDSGYTIDSIDVYPYRAAKRIFSRSDYFVFYETYARNLETHCEGSNENKVFVSAPYNVMPSRNFIKVQPGQSVLIAVKPTGSIIADQLKSYSPETLVN